jgi:hypothetical protein
MQKAVRDKSVWNLSTAGRQKYSFVYREFQKIRTLKLNLHEIRRVEHLKYI